MRDMRDIGRMGENIFQFWCNSVGLTANRSKVDKRGWDFFVEFPNNSSGIIPTDLVPTPIECKIQVKSTDRKKKGEPIELSNLESLVKTQVPVFFCFIEFDGKNDAQAAYLVHVGKEVIENTLKRIRKLYSEEKGDRLNKHRMTIKYTDSDRLESTTGQSLKRTIEKYIPNTLEKYIAEKNRLLATLGFENGKGQITVQMSGKDPVGDLIDLSLGIRDEVYIDQIISHHKRFEILSKNPLLSSEGAILNIKVKPEPVILKFKEHKFSPGIIVKAQLYRPHFNQLLPDKYLKLRIESTILELIIDPFSVNSKVKYSFDIREKQRNCLNDLKNNLKILTFLKNAPHSSVLEIIDEAKQLHTISFKIGLNDEIDDLSDIYSIAEMASLICQRFSISEDDVFVTLNELIQVSQSIESFHGILYAEPKTVSIDFPLDSEEYEQESRLAYISYAMMTIGNHTIVYFWAIIGSLALVNQNQYRLVAEDIFAGNKLVAIDGEVIEQSYIERIFNDFEEELQRMGLKTIRITPANFQDRE
jgi:hypothetical protein